MSPKTEQEYKTKIEELQKEIEILKKKQTEKMRSERYGLNWIDVPEAFEKESENKIPVLRELKEKAIRNDDGKPTHILIEGDNYHALKCLNYTHAGKIDVIYIDPPYNTGSKDNPFVYNDSRFLTEYPDGKPILVGDPIRHSSWLSFMYKRLKLAKNLLNEKGVIFISIDDNEQANLKLLCDQVFGEENRVSSFIIIRSEGGGLAKQAVIGHDYLLVYAKDISKFVPLKKNKDIRGKTIEKNGEMFWIETDWLRKEFGKYGTCHYEEIEKYYDEIKKREIDNGIENGNYILIPKDGMHIVGRLRNLAEDGSKLYTIQKHLNKDGAHDLEILDLNEVFPFPKPVSLIKEYVYGATFFHNQKNAKILDFFAGSGTTLQAIEELNEVDNGTRQCILIQAKEATFTLENDVEIPKKNSEKAYALGFKYINEITYERNRRVIQGYTNLKGEEIPGLGNSLKYYKTDFIGEHSEKLASDEDKILLAQKAGCLISLSENTLEEIKTTEYYQLYTDGKKLTAIYFNEDPEMFPDFVEDIAKVSMNSTTTHKTTVYVYCEGNPEIYENEFDDLTDIEIKAIPHPILQIYKTLNEAL